jgi:hypothetical protein
MGDWKPDSSFTVGSSAVYYWVVPANAGGEWTLTVPGGKEYTLRLQQQFQSVKGTAERDGREVPVEQFRVVGDRVILAIADPDGGVRLEGRIEGDRMIDSNGGERSRWSARRTGPAPSIGG